MKRRKKKRSLTSATMKPRLLTGGYSPAFFQQQAEHSRSVFARMYNIGTYKPVRATAGGSSRPNARPTAQSSRLQEMPEVGQRPRPRGGSRSTGGAAGAGGLHAGAGAVWMAQGQGGEGQALRCVRTPQPARCLRCWVSARMKVGWGAGAGAKGVGGQRREGRGVQGGGKAGAR